MWQQKRDAVRVGIATAFFLFGASVVLGVLMDAESLSALVLGLTAPTTAALAGVYAYRSALGGDR
ncbi:hypothetical protein AB0C74_39675 [Spirillospora sp. NPDC048832]